MRRPFGLTSQIRRAAASVAANIAEGHGRESTLSFVHFLRIAQGSLKELETHVNLATRVGIARGDETTDLISRCEAVGRQVRSLIRSLQRRADHERGGTLMRAVHSPLAIRHSLSGGAAP